MRTSEREAAWREYANQLGRLNVAVESLETVEIDFKAGFDAAWNVLAQRGDRVTAFQSGSYRSR